MKILQIVTLITPENAYGGPVRVALNQVRSLRQAGHQVELIAGAFGFDQMPESVDGVDIRLFRAIRLIPGTGFAGLFAPQMMAFLFRRAKNYDMIHIHLARDLITLPAADFVRLQGIPYVLQTHGMIDESGKLLAHVLDAFATKRVIRSAGVVFYLTPNEKASVGNLFDTVTQARLPNGVPIPANTARGRPTPDIEVLYLARLQARKRPLEFARAAKDILSDTNDVSFRLVGPDEGQGSLLSEFIELNSLQGRLTWEGPLSVDATLDRMAKATIYALPSVDEPFPMSVLEAMSLGLPVIITKSNGLAPLLDSHDAALIIDEQPGALSRAVRLLLTDENLRLSLGANARQLAIQEFSIDSVVRLLTEHYDRLLAAGPAPRKEVH